MRHVTRLARLWVVISFAAFWDPWNLKLKRRHVWQGCPHHVSYLLPRDKPVAAGTYGTSPLQLLPALDTLPDKQRAADPEGSGGKLASSQSLA